MSAIMRKRRHRRKMARRSYERRARRNKRKGGTGGWNTRTAGNKVHYGSTFFRG